MCASESRMHSQSSSALLSEFATAEMSLHAIYMHEVSAAPMKAMQLVRHGSQSS